MLSEQENIDVLNVMRKYIGETQATKMKTQEAADKQASSQLYCNAFSNADRVFSVAPLILSPKASYMNDKMNNSGG